MRLKLDKLLSLIVVLACVITFFYSMSGYMLESSSPHSSQLINRDSVALVHNHMAAGQHVQDARINALVDRNPVPHPTDSPTIHSEAAPTKPPKPRVPGYKIVGEGLLVPEGKEKSFLFIKTHKCGTSTMVNMLYLYGIRRRLNFVTQPWQRGLDVEMPLLPPRSGEEYNFQIAHATFKPERQHELLPKFKTFYTTIIRSPIKRFVSAFAYYGIDRSNNRAEDGTLLSLEATIQKWFDQNQTVFAPTNETCSIGPVVNGLSKDLGFQEYLDRPGTLQSKINDFIEDLAQEMDFVLLTDFFDESLVLLKEQMGWEFQDIFFMKRFYTVDRSRKDSTLSQKTIELIYKFNTVDVQLYNFFYQTFKMKVTAYGVDLLKQKTAEFRQKRIDFENSCFNKPEEDDKSQTFNKEWTLTDFGQEEKSCTLLHMRDILLDFLISELQVTKDFTSPDAEEMMKIWSGKHSPMSPEDKELVTSIQKAYDDHGVEMNVR